ncbi:MAG TPA: MFS transporter [Longimicrobiales bacterium]|nr:MFS transporter [Longimicrobiales bacterium]
MEAAGGSAAARVAGHDVEWTPPPLSRRDRFMSMAATLIALSLAGLDQTIVATAGPAIQRDLAIPAALYAWITTAYLVASTVMLPIYGKLSDVLGRKPVLIGGVSLFLLGSLLAGLAPNTLALIAARVVQGLGAASLFTTTLAVIADLYPPQVRGRYMGLIGAVMGITSVIGPLVGGIITDLFGWHWVFFVNLPLGALALAFIIRSMPRLGGLRNGAPVDVAGALWLIAGVVPLLVALSLGGGGEGGPVANGPAWTSPLVLALLAASVIGLAAFIVTELRAQDPVLDLRMLRTPAIGLPLAASFAVGVAFLFSLVFLPLFLVNVAGVSATRAGLTMIPLTFGIVGGSIFAGQLTSRIGHARAVLLGGLALLMAAFAIMAFTLSPAATVGGMSWKMVLIGLGIGPTMPLYTLLAQNAARARDLGVVSAAATFSRSIGQVIGITVFGSIFAAALGDALSDRVRPILDGLPADARSAVVAAAPAIAPGAGTADLAFDTAAVRAGIDRAFAMAEADAGDAANGAPPVPSTSAGPSGPTSRDAALAAIGPLSAAFNDALARALALLYRVGIAVIAIAFAITVFIPERPVHRLRHGP